MCDFCLQTAENNRKGEPEDLLICRDCGNRGKISHLSWIFWGVVFGVFFSLFFFSERLL